MPLKVSDLSYEHQQAVEAMKTQLIIVLLNRLGGSADIPVAEVDGTGSYVMAFNVVDGVFHFQVRKKADL